MAPLGTSAVHVEGAAPDDGGRGASDPRLAKFDATTFGVKWGTRLGHDGELNVRLERYSQQGDGPGGVPTQLQGLDLYPGLNAWLVQGGFRLLF
jgi:hypothetical protein